MLCSSARFILFQVKTQTANKLCFLTHHLSLDQQFVKIFVQWEESCSFVTLLHLNVLAKITNEFKFSAPSHLLCKFSIFWNYFLFIHMCDIYMCIYIYTFSELMVFVLSSFCASQTSHSVYFFYCLFI